MSTPPPIPPHILAAAAASSNTAPPSTSPSSSTAPNDVQARLAATLARIQAATGLRVESESVLGKRKFDDVNNMPPNSSSSSSSSSLNGEDNKRKRIFVPPELSQLFHDTHVALQIKTGTSIKIEHGQDPSEELVISINGDNVERVSAAEKLVNELVQRPDHKNAILSQPLSLPPPSSSSFNSGSSSNFHLPSFLTPVSSGNQFTSSGSGSSEVFHVVASRVGLIIGKGGETIKHIQQSCNVHIQIGKENEPGTDQRPINLQGSLDAIEKAKKEITRIVTSPDLPFGDGPPPHSSHSGSSSHRGGLGFHASHANDEQVMKVPNHLVGLIIGKQGETIKQLQLRTGATILIQKESEDSRKTGERDVFIRGADDSISMAKQDIDRIVKDALAPPPPPPPPPPSSGPPPGRGDGGDRDRDRDRGGAPAHPPLMLRIPSHCIGTLIGRGGETIKRLQAQTGCRIQINPDQSLPEREVNLIGGYQEIERAKYEIYQLIGDKLGPNVPAGLAPTYPSYGAPPYGAAPPHHHHHHHHHAAYGAPSAYGPPAAAAPYPGTMPAPYAAPPYGAPQQPPAQPYDYSAYYRQQQQQQPTAPQQPGAPGAAPQQPPQQPQPEGGAPPVAGSASAGVPNMTAPGVSMPAQAPPAAAPTGAGAAAPSATAAGPPGGYDYAAYQQYMQQDPAAYAAYYAQYYQQYYASQGAAPPSTPQQQQQQQFAPPSQPSNVPPPPPPQ